MKHGVWRVSRASPRSPPSPRSLDHVKLLKNRASMTTAATRLHLSCTITFVCMTIIHPLKIERKQCVYIQMEYSGSQSAAWYSYAARKRYKNTSNGGDSYMNSIEKQRNFIIKDWRDRCESINFSSSQSIQRNSPLRCVFECNAIHCCETSLKSETLLGVQNKNLITLGAANQCQRIENEANKSEKGLGPARVQQQRHHQQ